MIGRTVILALTLLATAQAARVEYRVQSGDTAWSISRRHGLSVEELTRRAGLQSTDLKIGQVLVFETEKAEAKPETPPAETASVPAPTVERISEIFQQGMAVYYTGKGDGTTALTAAHLTLPFGTLVKVTHARSGRSVVVKINDRGPFGRAERVIDISTEAARQLGILSEGVAPVVLEIVSRP